MITFAHVRSVVEEKVLQRNAEARAARRPEEERASLQRLLHVAQERVNASKELRDGPYLGARVILLRDAATFALRAIAVDEAVELPSVDDRAAMLAALSNVERVAAIPDAVRELLTASSSDLPSDADEARVGALERHVAILAKSVETRTGPQIKRSRILRVGTVSAVGAYVLFKLIWAIVAPTNYALDKPVWMSSIYPGSPPAAGLTDGARGESSYGAATQSQNGPWIQVDLGQVVNIRRVKVYPRGDGHEDEGVPVVLESSEDGSNWHTMDRRVEPWVAGVPWIYRGSGVRGRWVRLRAEGHTLLALNEIEVYTR